MFRSNLDNNSSKSKERTSVVPSFLDGDILDFTADADFAPPPRPPTNSHARPSLPPPAAESVDLLDGFYDMSVSAPVSSSVTPVPVSSGGALSADQSPLKPDNDDEISEVSDHADPQAEGDDLPQRREEYIKLFMRADIVYASPLTRALQTALASMCGHPALTKNKLTLYR